MKREENTKRRNLEWDRQQEKRLRLPELHHQYKSCSSQVALSNGMW